MSTTFSFKGDEPFTQLYLCRHVEHEGPDCWECKKGIVSFPGDAHSCNMGTGTAIEVCRIIDIKFDDCCVAFKPTLEQVIKLANYNGDLSRYTQRLADTILAALHFGADEIVGG